MTLVEQKDRLRREMRARLRALDATARADASARLCARVLAHESWRAATSVCLFVPLPSEPDISPLLKAALAAGKILCVPRLDEETGCYLPARVLDLERDLQRGQFGVPEPGPGRPAFPANQLDLALIPGLCFSPGGWRLGRGKGHYDRLLSLTGCAKCGLGFDEQMVETLPVEPHDIRLDFILTPGRQFNAGGARL